MKFIIKICFLLSVLFSFSCVKNDINIPNKPLEGIVNGKKWKLKFGKANLVSSDGTYQMVFYSDEEIFSNPCALGVSTLPHAQVHLPLTVGSYSLPLIAQFESFKFIFGNGTSLFATSGFIEIYALNSTQILGYLQAIVDDKNTIEGKFTLDIC